MSLLPQEHSVALGASGAVTALAYPGTPDAAAIVVLAHGAGAGQRSVFMVEFAQAMAARAITAVTFNFPYTEQQRKVPDRRPVLDGCYRSIVEFVRGEKWGGAPLFIGGKSMGGRIATHIAAEDPALKIDGLVLLGYPLHPPGRPDQRRDAHLPNIGRPVFIVQGSRDTFGTPAELEPILDRMHPRPTLHVIQGGDHSFKVSKAGTAGQRDILKGIHDATADWIRSGIGDRGSGS